MPAMLLIAAAVAAIVAPQPTPVSVKTSPIAAAQAKPIKAVDADTMVCKTIETTGTRFTSRDCRTKGQWDQLAADSRDLTNDFTRPLDKREP